MKCKVLKENVTCEGPDYTLKSSRTFSCVQEVTNNETYAYYLHLLKNIKLLLGYSYIFIAYITTTYIISVILKKCPDMYF